MKITVLAGSPRNVNTTATVSYTHLDVYKRQELVHLQQKSSQEQELKVTGLKK